MASHIAQRAGAEILPTAPHKRMIYSALATAFASAVCSISFGPSRPVRTFWRGSKPEVPIERRRNRILARRPVHALRPNRSIAPNMHLANRADNTRLDNLDCPPQTIFGAALVAHFGRDTTFFRQLAQQPRFINRLRQWLLAINMFAHFDGHRGDNSVQMVRSRDDDGVERLFSFQHLAEITIKSSLWVFHARARGTVFVDVANGDYV